MDENSLSVLEFPRIRELIAANTSFSLSHDLALALYPLNETLDIRNLLEEVNQARKLISVKPDFSIGFACDIRDWVKEASLGKSLDPASLILVQRTLASFRIARQAIIKTSVEIPRLQDIALRLKPQGDLEKAIGNAISPDGEVLDSASEALAAIRDALRDTRRRISEKLTAIIASPRLKKILQEPIITEREGRYVIPVKREHGKEVRGIVHDLSNSGVTVFIEPWPVVELGNSVRELVTEEKREIERILAALSRQVGDRSDEIMPSLESLAYLDLVLAKAIYADSVRGSEPTVMEHRGNGEELKLVEARHPLLKGRVVPLNLSLGPDFKVLLISGPNAGGKTVALKTIGLLSLMVQSGIPVPAREDSIFPVFKKIFADIGDEQSIDYTLSTFSGHISNMVRILREASPAGLVLLDELGTSTDPVEGAALSRAILATLKERGSMVVATTHLNDLKVFAHETPGLKNASFEFDPVSLLPTYHINPGVPGGSNALAMALNMGLSPEIVEVARSFLSSVHRETETLITELMEERGRLMNLMEEFRVKNENVNRMEAELNRGIEELGREKTKLAQETRDRLLTETAALLKEVREVSLELKKKRSSEALARAKKSAESIRESLSTRSVETAPEIKAALAPGRPYQSGDTVRLVESGITAEVISVIEDESKIWVRSGDLKLLVNINSVVPLSQGDNQPDESFNITAASRGIPVALELDLRGKRAEEVEPILDIYLNDVFMARLNQVRVIHGYGTGTVRQIARDYLARHPLVASFRAGEKGEGGDGVTVVKLGEAGNIRSRAVR